ncbi:MAG: N-acetylneuraminate synthase [Gammaproteobacteria bacterium]|nr:N-acetylneuraminate synthase [Gammaproteobacteria bacterium]MBU0788285.1 N-acetylneuraminate synthase [Gammaproteobacteria bacterium]MBU0815218.1 N-acetylneuraminate synthase [Gammaproteobacteria bacterium]MBU1785674.1 N-acetylneuraminate synthase [Gammaproteobacteria bacterium]
MKESLPTLVIAEAGVNHNGDMDLAFRLVDVAAEAGADYVKFQTFSADRLVTRTAPKADYQARTTSGEETQHTMLRRLELTAEMHRALMTRCAESGIGFLSTGFDTESVDFLHGLGQRVYKIPSGEITNLLYLRHIGRLGGEVILSTGMANLGEVEAALETIESVGMSRSQITVLHCTTEYPTPVSEVNLRAMVSMQSAFGVRVGYSDHTQGIEVPIAAVALGACVIEKHFTLDRNLPGPDHMASLEPQELKAMIGAIRHVEKALGDGIKRPTLSEGRNRLVVRKSIVAARGIRQGEFFSVENLAIKRPGGGLSPMLFDDVVGRSAQRDFAADDLIFL